MPQSLARGAGCVSTPPTPVAVAAITLGQVGWRAQRPFLPFHGSPSHTGPGEGRASSRSRTARFGLAGTPWIKSVVARERLMRRISGRVLRPRYTGGRGTHRSIWPLGLAGVSELARQALR